MHRNVTWIIQRANWRTLQDRGNYGQWVKKVPEEDLSPGGRSHPSYRCWATMAYAVSIETKRRYRGYSGSAGGMRRDHEMRKRRYERIRPILESEEVATILNEEHGGEWPKAKNAARECGEAAALAIAMSHMEKPTNLIFIAFTPSRKDKARVLCDPCDNCALWIGAMAYGYVDKTGQGYRAGRRGATRDNGLLELIR